jgi:hypothetical protein
LGIHQQCQSLLSHLIAADNSFHLLSDTLQCRHQDAHQQRNDCDYYEQLDKRKTLLCAFHEELLLNNKDDDFQIIFI